MQPVTFESDGRRLVGVLDMPEGEPRGAVVIVHGWGGCRIGPHRILVQAGRALAEAGFAALRFDITGRGDSEGEPLETDLDMMIADTRAALAFLRGRLPGVPAGLLGMCSGGNVALASAALQGDVDAVVAWSTYPFQEQRTARQDARRTGHMLKVYAQKLFRASTWKKLLHGRVNFKMVRRAILGKDKAQEGERNLQESRRDVLGPLGNFGGRVLLIFGGNDPEAGDARDLFEQFAGEHGLRMDFHQVEGANHNFYSAEWKSEVLCRTVDWMRGAVIGG